MTCDDEVIIPDEIDGLKVVAIGLKAFYNKGLTKVTIPNSVTSIGYESFRSNNLLSIVLPSSLISIEGLAFAYNKLENLIIPSSVLKIQNYSFNNNSISNVIVQGKSSINDFELYSADTFGWIEGCDDSTCIKFES